MSKKKKAIIVSIFGFISLSFISFMSGFFGGVQKFETGVESGLVTLFIFWSVGFGMAIVVIVLKSIFEWIYKEDTMSIFDPSKKPDHHSKTQGYELGAPDNRQRIKLDDIVEKAISEIPAATRLYPEVYAWKISDAIKNSRSI